MKRLLLVMLSLSLGAFARGAGFEATASPGFRIVPIAGDLADTSADYTSPAAIEADTRKRLELLAYSEAEITRELASAGKSGGVLYVDSDGVLVIMNARRQVLRRENSEGGQLNVSLPEFSDALIFRLVRGETAAEFRIEKVDARAEEAARRAKIAQEEAEFRASAEQRKAAEIAERAAALKAAAEQRRQPPR